MNVVLTLVGLSSSLNLAEAVRCGKWFSNACRAESDIRYDKSASNSFVDQAAIWARINGLYMATGLNYDAQGLPATSPSHFFPASGTGFPYDDMQIIFVNVTTFGSRYIEQRININGPADQAFCDQDIPAGGSNVINLPGINTLCGVNGFISYAEGFSTTSQEKDGRALQLPLSLPSIDVSSVDFSNRAHQDGSFPSASGNAIFTSSTAAGTGGNFTIFDTLACIDVNCSQITRSTESYFDTGALALFGGSSQLLMTRVTTTAWVQGLEDAYEANGILFPIAVPFTHNCLGEQTGFSRCPTEEEWCTRDPNCAPSLYEEPDGTVKAGVIAGFTVTGFVMIIGLLFFLHLRAMAAQKERNRIKFARRIAETIRLEGSTRQLTPDALADEFKKYSAADGTISKQDLWDFVSSGRAGAMSEDDFDALFAAIDLDKSGTVDFLEFCTYMGQCNEDFEAVKGRPSILRSRPSFAVQSQRRSSVAESTAQKLASLRILQETIEEDEEEEADPEE